MASNYPSVIASLTNPNPTDRLNAPSHSSIHGAVNDEVTQLETFVGTISSAVGTLVYDIRAAASNGGGHVQAANTGGTGQTAYTKGDMLVATSSSVLAKLSVSSTAGDILTVDPNQSAGIKWAAGPASTKIDTKYTNLSKAAGAASAMTTYYAGSVLGSTLGTANAVRYSVDFPTFNVGDTSTSIVGQVLYGNNVISNFSTTAISTSIVGALVIEGMIIGASSVNSQLGYVKGFISKPNVYPGNANAFTTQTLFLHGTGTSSVDSAANQNLLVQLQVTGAQNVTSVLSGVAVVEKIA